jgi:hypothetical protein
MAKLVNSEHVKSFKHAARRAEANKLAFEARVPWRRCVDGLGPPKHFQGHPGVSGV